MLLQIPPQDKQDDWDDFRVNHRARRVLQARIAHMILTSQFRKSPGDPVKYFASFTMEQMLDWVQVISVYAMKDLEALGVRKETVQMWYARLLP